MRAICDACSKPQPAEWRAGDLCVHCGAAVREEVRCFWCAKWTPSGSGAKFCRSCGGELVLPQQYGPARMLKDAGADRFTVPKMLRDLDPAQIENFGRIYQRHLIIVARHVDQLRTLEQVLFQSHWSGALEEELIPQLPWNEATLAAYAAPPTPFVAPPLRRGEPPPGPVSDEVQQVRQIEAGSPFPLTRQLASLARMRLADWSAIQNAATVFRGASAGSPLKLEAALTLSRWKIGFSVGYLREDREILQVLQTAAAQPPPTGYTAALMEAITVGRAILGEKEVEGLSDAISSANPENAFAATLVLKDIDRLQAALKRTPLEQIAAGRKLIQIAAYGGLAEVLPTCNDEVQMAWVDELRNTKTPLPMLADALMRLYESTDQPRLRVRAAEVLCRELNPDWARRLCVKAGDEQYIFQSLLSEKAALPPETVAEVAQFMIGNGRFRMSQYGLPEAARRGAVPDSFVPRAFDAAPAETRLELLRCAEEQLKARGDETLHRFVMNTLFGPYDAKTRSTAWWALSRWYVGIKYGSKGPLVLSTTEVTRFFGSVGAFLPKLTTVLNHHETMKEVGLYEFIADLLRSSTDDFTQLLLTDSALEGSAHELVQALLATVASDYWPNVRSNAAELLTKLGAHKNWRDEILSALETRLADANFDLRYYCDRAVKTIKGEWKG